MTRLFAGTVGCVIAIAITASAIADDSTIAQQLSADLRLAKQTKILEDFRINVRVEDGVVWMTGSVDDAQQKTKALDIARRVSGVRLVVNDLNVAGADEQQPRSAEIAATSAQVEATVNSSAPSTQAVANAIGTRSSSPAISGIGAISDTTAGVRQAAAQLQAAKLQTAKLQMEAAQLQIARNRLLQTQIASQRAALAKQADGNRLVNYCADGGCGVGGSRGGTVYDGASYGGTDMGYGGGVSYETAQVPNYAWPSYAASPNYAALSYPKQYSAQAWPYIGPFYPYPQVPLGWRKVSLEWDDGWWMLDFTSK